jgi:hypothetical protein
MPTSVEEWDERVAERRRTLEERFRIPKCPGPLDFQIHGEVPMEGYRIQKVSFLSAPEVRVTANLFIPDGEGPFPAVLNCHGHWMQGKIAAKVQARGHFLALNGIVTLSVDAAGSGDRADDEREFTYHGATRGGELFLYGDSLLALQVRDNKRAVDALQSLTCVDPERIGVIGASGGGNQTMWLAAMDERVKVAVPVVSVGSFEAYIGRCNCVCETLPGGLAVAEEWEILGAMAPKPLLVINALHDQPAFGYEPMSQTCRRLQEVYTLFGYRHHFDSRILDMTHGFHPEASEVVLGWLKHWLCGAPGSNPVALPQWNDVEEDDLLCFPKGERPENCSFRHVRKSISIQALENRNEASIENLARLVGWKAPTATDWLPAREDVSGAVLGTIQTNRGLPLPVGITTSPEKLAGEVRVILSPAGKRDEFVREQLLLAQEAGADAVTLDLPSTGELAWDDKLVAGSPLHDATRACLWLGYTLVGEWAEAIAAVVLTLQKQAPGTKIRLIAKGETAFATLLACALAPLEDVRLTEIDTPKSVMDPKSDTLVWMVPGFVPWGDLDTLRSYLE